MSLPSESHPFRGIVLNSSSQTLSDQASIRSVSSIDSSSTALPASTPGSLPSNPTTAIPPHHSKTSLNSQETHLSSTTPIASSNLASSTLTTLTSSTSPSTSISKSTQKEGWLNKSSASSSYLSTVPQNSANINSRSSKHSPFLWKLNKVFIRENSLYVYKPPSDVSMKSFDSSLPAPPPALIDTYSNYKPETSLSGSQSATLPTFNSFNENNNFLNSNHNDSSNSLYHRRGYSASVSNLAPSLASSTTLAPSASNSSLNVGSNGDSEFTTWGPDSNKPFNTDEGNITHFGLEPHPDLVVDESGKVINGPLDAICHTILFDHNEKFVTTAILFLPLIHNMVLTLNVLSRYISHPSSSNYEFNVINSLVSRVKLVVELIKREFPGMLLQTTIFSALLRLIEIISSLNDIVATELKLSVFRQQKTMSGLLQFSPNPQQEPIPWKFQQELQPELLDSIHIINRKAELNNQGSTLLNDSNNQSLLSPNSSGQSMKKFHIDNNAPFSNGFSLSKSNHNSPSSSTTSLAAIGNSSTLSNASNGQYNNNNNSNNSNITNNDHHHTQYGLSSSNLSSSSRARSQSPSFANSVVQITGLPKTASVETIPPNLFLRLSIDLLASQIYYFHLVFSHNWSPTNDISLLFNVPYDYKKYNPLVFNSHNNHFLGKLLLDHLFWNAGATNGLYRARILTHWIKLGNALKNQGDMVGWLAIATVVCSVPVLRLQNSWDLVEESIRGSVIREWAPVVFDLERRLMISDNTRKSTYHVLAPQGIGITYPKERVVPFFGDLCIDYEASINLKQCENKLNRIKTAFDKWHNYLENVTQKNGMFEPGPVPVESLQKLLHYLSAHHAETRARGPKQILELSLKIEPATSGNYLKYYYGHTSPLSYGSYLPLLFTDVISSYKLFAKNDLIAASGVNNVQKRSHWGSLSSSSSTSASSSVSSLSSGYGPLSSSSVSLIHSSSASTVSRGSVSHTNGSNAESFSKSQNLGGLHRSMSFPPSKNNLASLTTGLSELDLSSREIVQQNPSRHTLMRNVRDVLNVGATFYHIRDDLVLKSLEDIGSRSSSVIEAPSKRLSAVNLRPLSGSLTAVNSNSGTVSKRVSSGIGHNSFDFSAASNTNGAPSGTSTGGNRNSFLFSSNTFLQSFPVAVVVKSATLDRLVDLLVFDVNNFSSLIEQGDLPNGDGKSYVPRITMDNSIYALTFFATFRSFCSSTILLDCFKKRFLGAKFVAGQLNNIDAKNFPFWDGPINGADGISMAHDSHWDLVFQIQASILQSCLLWVSQYFSDFVNEFTVREKFLDLLRIFEIEISKWVEIPSFEKDSLSAYVESLEILLKKLRKQFIRKSYRPLIGGSQMPVFEKSTLVVNIPIKCPLIEIERYLEDLNVVTSALFKAIKVIDWISTFEILELQSTKITGFFNTRSTSMVHEEDIIIQNIFTYFSTLYNETPDDKVLLLLPAPIQELFKIHSNLVNYFTAQIADPGINRDTRIKRMVTLLKALGIIKQRMKNLELFSSSPDENLSSKTSPTKNENINSATSQSMLSPNVPSFVESAISYAIVQPESRMFANSWIQASMDTNNDPRPQFDSLDNMIPKISSQELSSEFADVSMTPCIGWIIERILEIVCYVPNMSVENNHLINFDKSRYIYNLVTNITDIQDFLATNNLKNEDSMTEAGNRATSTNVTTPLPVVNCMSFVIDLPRKPFLNDKKALKDVASRENKEYGKTRSKNKVFTRYILAEIEKTKRDAKSQDTLERRAKDSKKGIGRLRAGSNSIVSSHSTNSSNTLSTATIAEGVHDNNNSNQNQSNNHATTNFNQDSPTTASAKKSGKSRFGGILKAVRPFSMALSATWMPPAEPQRIASPSELPAIGNFPGAKVKPLCTILLRNADIYVVPAFKSQGVFAIATEDGTEHYFQAYDEKSAIEWVQAALAVKRRIGHNTVTNRNGELASKDSNGSTSLSHQNNNHIALNGAVSQLPTRVFGVPVSVVCERENTVIPKVVDMLLTEIENRGLEESGIYRLSASIASVSNLKLAFDLGEKVDMKDDRWFDINIIAGCFKLYLRELPEPLLSEELFPEFIATASLKSEPEIIRRLNELVHKLPPISYKLLERLMSHLSLVASKCDVNRMPAVNLAIVFTMSFLLPLSVENGVSSNLGLMQTVLKNMITHNEKIFAADFTALIVPPVDNSDANSSTKKNENLNKSNDLNLGNDVSSFTASSTLTAPSTSSLGSEEIAEDEDTLNSIKFSFPVPSKNVVTTSIPRVPPGRNPNRRFSVLMDNKGSNLLSSLGNIYRDKD